jgi:hypothetical protein
MIIWAGFLMELLSGVLRAEVVCIPGMKIRAAADACEDEMHPGASVELQGSSSGC